MSGNTATPSSSPALTADFHFSISPPSGTAPSEVATNDRAEDHAGRSLVVRAGRDQQLGADLERRAVAGEQAVGERRTQSVGSGVDSYGELAGSGATSMPGI